MRLAIDAYRLVAEPRTSGAIYVAELVRALAQEQLVEKIYLLLCRPLEASSDHSWLKESEKVTLIVSPITEFPEEGVWNNLKWVQRSVPALVKRHCSDIQAFVAPYHQTPILLPRRIKVTTVIHDLCGLRCDAGYGPRRKAYWLHTVNFLTAILRADVALPISATTAKDIMRRLPRLGRRLTQPVYNNVSAHLVPREAAEAVLEKLGLPWQGYFLAFGGGDFRKGADICVRAFHEYRQAGGTRKLAIIGMPQVERLGVAREWQDLAEDAMVFASVTGPERDCLYRGSSALLFFSRCEGFGYPIVEAMLQGCPPIAWIDTPAAELVPDGFALLPSLDVSECVTAMFAYDHAFEGDRALLARKLIAHAGKFQRTDFGAEFLMAIRP